MLKFRIIIALFAFGLILGVLFALQIQSPPPRVTNPITPYLTLQETKEVLEKDQTMLKESIATLRKYIADSQEQSKSSKKTSKQNIEKLEKLKDKAGLTIKSAKGLVITLADSERGDPTVDSIVHAADLRDVVNLLWSKDAQAVSINEQRVVLTSSIDSIVNTILVNNTKIANPFVIKAVGDQDNLRQALLSGEFLKDISRRQKNTGLIFNVETVKEVNIPAYDGGFAIKFAKIKD